MTSSEDIAQKEYTSSIHSAPNGCSVDEAEKQKQKQKANISEDIAQYLYTRKYFVVYWCWFHTENVWSHLWRKDQVQVSGIFQITVMPSWRSCTPVKNMRKPKCLDNYWIDFHNYLILGLMFALDHQGSFQLSVKWLRWESAPPILRPWFSAGKWWIALWVGGELPLQVKEFQCLRVLFMSEWRMEWEMDRHIGGASAVMQACSGPSWWSGSWPKGKAFNWQVHL